MRLIPLSAAALLACGSLASAEPAGRDIRYVTGDIAEVHASPSVASVSYVTNRLRKGTAVEVMGEEPDGWLKIRPPQGSFSYVNTTFLKHLDPNYPNHVVILEGVKVPVYVGSEVVDKRPTIVGVSVGPGHQVISRGKPIADKDGLWMPIVPPDLERRYIRASLLGKESPDQTAQLAGQSHATFTPGPNGLAASAAPSANPALTTEQMWAKACQAERSGQMQEAIKLYAQVAANTVSSNPQLSNWAFQRAHFLRAGYRTYGQNTVAAQPASSPPTQVVSATPVSRASGAVQVGAPSAPGAVPAVAVPQPAIRNASTFAPVLPTTPPPRVGNSMWLGYRGVLRKSGRTDEGVQTFVIDDPVTLRPLVEFTPSRGMNLDLSLGRTVTVWGYTWYRGDLRRNFMTASHLLPG